MRDFRGRTCVVTGAASGIGRALAVELADRGARLAVSDVDDVGLAATAEACRRHGAEVLSSHLDVAEEDAWRRHADDVVERFGTVHMLVNNAGLGLVAGALEQSTEQMRRIIDVDFWGVAHGTRAFWPHLVASGDGALVNVSSIFGMVGVPRQSAYNAAKFAVRGFTEAVAQEARTEGVPVTVHTVHPGGIRTNVARNALRVAGDDVDAGAAFDRLARTSPERCARVVLRGVLRGRRRILVGADARVLHLLQQVLGVRYQAVVRPLVTAAIGGAGSAAGQPAQGGDAAVDRRGGGG